MREAVEREEQNPGTSEPMLVRDSPRLCTVAEISSFQQSRASRYQEGTHHVIAPFIKTYIRLRTAC